MVLLQAETDHYGRLLDQQVKLSDTASRLWRGVVPAAITPTWNERIPRLTAEVTAAQVEVARSSLIMSAGVMADQKSWAAPTAFLDPEQFGGFAPDGRGLQSLLYAPVIEAKSKIKGGMNAPAALKSAESDLLKITMSVLADTARQASSVMSAMRPGTGYVRVAHGDACDRCLILAGRFYRWNAGFLRHPQCDCTHESIHLSPDEAKARGLYSDPYEAFNDLSEAEQNARFGKDRAQAIRDGADIFQVVNSKRGMTPNGLFTTEGTTRLGNAYKGLQRGQRRATPELIYKWAKGSRTEAQRLLEQHGYILPGGQNPMGSLRGPGTSWGTGGRTSTMTAAQKRLQDAEQAWMKVLQGQNPYTSPGFGKQKTGGALPTPLTPEIAATVEKHYLETLIKNGEKFVR